MERPFERRIRAEIRLRKFAETFLGEKNLSGWAILFATLLLLVSGWLPDGLSGLFQSFYSSDHQIWFSLFKTLVSILVLLLLYKQLKVKAGVDSRIKVEVLSPVKTRVLGLFLSPLSMNPAVNAEKKSKIEELLQNGALDLGFFFNDKSREPWEMPLRAIQHHLSSDDKIGLQSIRVFTSCSDGATTNLFPLFRAVVAMLFPNLRDVIEFTPGGIDFEAVEKVFEEVNRFYRQAEEQNYTVLLDVTGGLKTSTVAGALATLASGRRFQYVSTNKKDVKSYDVVYDEGEQA